MQRSTPFSRLVPVILSGGMGTRLWPMSRQQCPKQFLKLDSAEHSLIQQTVQRVADRSLFAAPIIICNEEHRFLVAEHLRAIGVNDAMILLEPTGKNTAAAIALAAHIIEDRDGGHASMLVLPSDHIITDQPRFIEAVAHAKISAASGYLTTFGITPGYAETGYGYIQTGNATAGHSTIREVARFVEKPDSATASTYVESGDYLWNSGMFCFSSRVLLEELTTYRPDITHSTERTARMRRQGEEFTRFDAALFAQIPAESIDYAVMEHTRTAAVVPLDCGWSDAGAWDTLWRIHDKDEAGNASIGQNTLVATQNSYIRADEGIHVATLGVENLIIVATHDAVLVADKSRAQEVRALTDTLCQTMPELVTRHRRVHRPWGYYDRVDAGERHQVKRIVVNPGEKLSLQMHYHRAEHWIVVSGTALVTRDDSSEIISENQSVYISNGVKHRLENPGKIPLQLIEVQSGSYLEEDDIIRFDDDYGREEQPAAARLVVAR